MLYGLYEPIFEHLELKNTSISDKNSPRGLFLSHLGLFFEIISPFWANSRRWGIMKFNLKLNFMDVYRQKIPQFGGFYAIWGLFSSKSSQFSLISHKISPFWAYFVDFELFFHDQHPWNEIINFISWCLLDKNILILRINRDKLGQNGLIYP